MFIIVVTNIYWIDVCPNNGNLLVSSCGYENMKIFDKRNSKIVRTFDRIHTGSCNIF